MMVAVLIAFGLMACGSAFGALGHWWENRRRWRRNLQAMRSLGEWRKDLPGPEAERRMLRRLLLSKPRMDTKGHQ